MKTKKTIAIEMLLEWAYVREKVHLAREPEYPRCARALGQIFGKISDYGRARKWIGVYLGYPHAPDAEARDAYRRLLEMGQ